MGAGGGNELKMWLSDGALAWHTPGPEFSWKGGQERSYKYTHKKAAE